MTEQYTDEHLEQCSDPGCDCWHGSIDNADIEWADMEAPA